MQNRVGQQVIQRILAAYDFTSRQGLCEHLDISQSTMANRYVQGTFPADWIIQCTLETSMSLDWLVSGIGKSVHKSTNEFFKLQKLCLTQVILKEDGEYICDKNYISIKKDSLYIIVNGKKSYICDSCFNHVEDGKWLIALNGQKTLRDIIPLPKSKAQAQAQAQVQRKDNTVVCNKDGITFISFVKMIITEVKK